jgi:hypothetical protein
MPWPISLRAINHDPTFVVSGIHQRILAPATPGSLAAHLPQLIVYININSTNLHHV